MTLKLLLDQGLPLSTAGLLRQDNLDTMHVGEIGYTTATDIEVLEYARLKGRVVVTLDADFHAQLALLQELSPSVIRIRIEGLKASALAKLLQNVCVDCIEDLEQGAAVTVQTKGIRVHRLPLIAQ